MKSGNMQKGRKAANRWFFAFVCMWIAVLCVMHNGCAPNRIGVKGLPSNRITAKGRPFFPQYPPGVDSALVKYSLQLSKTLFIPPDSLDKSKKIKKNGIVLLSDYNSLDSLKLPQDSLGRTLQFKSQIQRSGASPVTKAVLERSLEKGGIETAWNTLAEEKENLLLKADRLFKLAYRLNPRDVDLLLYYAQTNTHLGTCSESSSVYFRKAEDLLNSALEIDRGGHDILFFMAENYKAEKKWREAADCYRRASETLRSFGFLPKNMLSDAFDAYVDSSRIFRYTKEIADMYTKLYDSPNALQSLNEAISLARTEAGKKVIEDYIAWINWANGNIAAREKFEEADALEKERKYAPAAQKYLQVINATKTDAPRAFWEASWRLSKLETTFLEKDSVYLSKHRFGGTGLDRLREVVRLVPKDSAGNPTDTLFNGVFNDYGIMLRNQASMKLKKEGEKELAIKLFTEGAVLRSNIQGKHCLQMTRFFQYAQLTGLLWAVKTFGLRDQLDREEMRELSQLCKRVTRNPQNRVMTLYFNQKFALILDSTQMQINKRDELMTYEFLRSACNEMDRRLFEQYGVRQDTEASIQYARLYREGENQLSGQDRESLRREIFEYYSNNFKKPDDLPILADWRSFLD